VPVILESHPYRFADASAADDEARYGWFAAHGYACARVDIRGSGDSDGILFDEYLPREIDDGVATIAWLADQPWCSGKVGLIGKSWSAFNALQIAARRPPALAAVIALMGSDDRFATDVHYYGGCLLAWDMLSWAATMLGYNARPPSPELPDWHERWLERIDASPPFIHAWVAHQRHGDYWRSGSVIETPDAITCPVYLVGGWADGYRDSVLRMFATSQAPLRGMIGPWGHVYPHVGDPGPRIGFLEEALRWWDTHLRGVPTRIEQEPALRLWLQDAYPPGPLTRRPGSWIGMEGQIEPLAWELPGTGEVTGGFLPVVDPGLWCGVGLPTDYPSDQQPEDANWCCFDHDPLPADLRLLGSVRVNVGVVCDQPVALLAARLLHVWPDGSETLIARGALNLNHLASRDAPEPLVPGQVYQVQLELGSASYRVPAGHRLRLALSGDYWPWLWPSPKVVTLQIRPGGWVEFPVLAEFGDPMLPAHLAEPEPTGLPPGYLNLPGPAPGRRWIREGDTLRIIDNLSYAGGIELPDGRRHRESGSNTYELTAGDPLSARLTADREIEMVQAGHRIRITTASTMSCTAEDFILTDHLTAWDGKTQVAEKHWEERIPRDFQ
jgi:predicted acyl esterase